MNSNSSIFTAEGLSYQYGSFLVFDDISFSVMPGEIVFLVGANGSGKSTLLRCLAGWTMPKTGVLKINGKPLASSDRSLRSKISFVPDMPPFYDDLTAGEHVDFVLKANRKECHASNARQLFADFGLLKHIDQYPSSYSRGMRTKLAIILALVLLPDVLLLDEPFGCLDSQATAVLNAELQKITEGGACALISCHQRIVGLTPSKVFHLHDEKLDIEQATALDRLSLQNSEALCLGLAD